MSTAQLLTYNIINNLRRFIIGSTGEKNVPILKRNDRLRYDHVMGINAETLQNYVNRNEPSYIYISL